MMIEYRLVKINGRIGVFKIDHDKRILNSSDDISYQEFKDIFKKPVLTFDKTYGLIESNNKKSS